jgi:DNA-binding NarL/FixJ family response regulator
MYLVSDKMKTILLSADENLLLEWGKKVNSEESLSAYNAESLQSITNNALYKYIIIADYDTVAPLINKMLTSNELPEYLIVLEKTPETLIGKNLILHGVKAYGNSRMLAIHFSQMLETVQSNQVWSYPQLTAQLAKTKTDKLHQDAQGILRSRLTEKEQEATLLILEGLTNDAIANKLDITVRTVKAHVSSIFQKLHVSDRLSLVLLLK